jgi:hypothetical protein
MCGSAQCPRDRKVTMCTGRRPGNAHSDPANAEDESHRLTSTRLLLQNATSPEGKGSLATQEKRAVLQQ